MKLVLNLKCIFYELKFRDRINISKLKLKFKKRTLQLMQKLS